MPKLGRVISGEKIVVSTLLESRFSSTTNSSNELESSQNVPISAEERQTVTLGDPMPRLIELEILRLNDTLQAVQTLWYERQMLRQLCLKLVPMPPDHLPLLHFQRRWSSAVERRVVRVEVGIHSAL